MLNHRAFGELDAVLITSVLVPILSVSVQQSSVRSLHLLLLILPPAFAKLSLFLLLNQADRRPDYAGGKVTLPVILGDSRTATLHRSCMHACYATLALIIIYAISSNQFVVASAGICMAFSASMGYRIVNLLRNMPYRLDHVLPHALLHSTMIMWGMLFHALVIRIPRDGIVSFPVLVAGLLGGLTMRAFRKRPAKTDVEAGVVEDPMENDDATEPVNGGGEFAGDTNGLTSAKAFVDTAVRKEDVIISCDVTVIGGGVAGLVAATTLRRMGLSVAVLERRSVNDVDEGADLALWPGAITILKTFGVPDEFFDEECFPLDTVHMCNMDFSNGVAKILKTIDMGAVTSGTGEHFVLVPRQKLMSALLEIVPEGVIMYDCSVVDIVESEEKENVTVSYDHTRTRERRSLTSSVAIGADGARSRVRKLVSSEYGGEDAIRYCGEVCYRGILELSSMSSEERANVESLFPDRATDHTMRINYGAGLRSSFGYMTADGNTAFWWVKLITPSIPERSKLKECPWPEPLRSLHDLTPVDMFYMHPIEDSKSLPKWCGSRVVLIGDAAHVVTPNMGQGACLAAEDAFVLAVELAKHWKWPDGHLEAFYRYEFCRKPYAEGVATEARKQLFLGQLQAWPLVQMREWLLRVVPETVLTKTLRKNNFDVGSYVEEFREGEAGKYSAGRKR